MRRGVLCALAFLAYPKAADGRLSVDLELMNRMHCFRRRGFIQRGMSLNADKGIDHVGHGDRHERSEADDAGATAGVSGRYSRGRVLSRRR